MPNDQKMNPELKAKWVAALRSGEYEQGFHRFERDNRFCCLGVLCRVAGEPPVINDSRMGNWRFAESVVGASDMLLAAMNDEGKTFPEIADYIEEHL